MTITAIKDFKIKESYANLIRTKLWSYLWEGIYKPLFEIMQIKPQKAQNSFDPVVEGLREGRLYYVDGGFKAKDKFTNAQSLQLQKWGAKWDKYQKMYKIEQERLPQQIQVTLAQSQILAKQQIQLVQNYLKEVQANMPYIIDSMVFDNEVITILDDAGNEVKKNVKHLNVIEPELSIEQKREIARTYTNNMRDYVIKDFAQERIPEMRKKIQELVLKGYRPDRVQELLEKEYGIAGRKAKFLAQNETSIMLSEYKRVTYQEMGFDKFIWKTITDGRERELHKQLNNTTWSYDNPPVIDERTGQRGLPGQTYNCLVGEMNIATPFLYKRIFKRKFRGELTSIVLPMGIIKVTPNHPILTSRGWVAAKFIKVGDKVAKISSESFPAIGSNPNDIKITIEEFFGFYSILFKRERVAVSDKDFHGDISIDQQVDVINIENKLRDCFNPEFTKLKLEQFLTKAHKFGIYSASDRAFYQAFPFCWFTSDSFISRLSQVFSFFFSSEFHSVEHSLRAVAWLDSLLNETCGYSFSRDAEFLSQLFNTPAGSIKFYQLIVWNIFFNIISNNSISYLLHSNREMTCATAETLSNLSEAKPAFIEFDTVIDKIISKSSDIHIYNLENSNNWYLTENYITKNCRCEAVPFRSGSEIKIKGRISEKNSKDKISAYLIRYEKNKNKGKTA